MQRARRLLKAYSILNNTPTSVISQISCIVIYIVVGLCLMINLGGLLFNIPTLVNIQQNLSYLSVIIVLLTIRSVYTGFFEDKRKGTKNSLKALTYHLPISKKDFILAQYIGNLYLFLPAFILVIGLILFNLIAGGSVQYSFELGLIIIGFNLTYCLISLEKGMLTFYYIDPRLRELGYLTITFLWMGANYLIESTNTNCVAQIITEKQWLQAYKILCSFGQVSGLGLVIVALGLGYLFSVKLPIKLERRK